MNRFCFSIPITSFFRVLVSVCPSLGGYLQAFWSVCTRTINNTHKKYPFIQRDKAVQLFYKRYNFL
ncbi:hypothetical protein EXW35_28750 (plasmid) [Bacillus mycoides]|nr:hypothetical protein EXW35_28750 [Bacillus mycoides]QWI25373.1 hypothetical protein EXW34_29680 [Bacillus mycoides]